FEVTRLSCLLADNLKLKARPIDPRGTRFVTKDSDEIFLTPGPSADSVWFHDPSAASKVLFRHASARPETCTRQTSNDPVTNFEIFAETFAAHHGFLKHRGVDW